MCQARARLFNALPKHLPVRERIPCADAVCALATAVITCDQGLALIATATGEI